MASKAGDPNEIINRSKATTKGNIEKIYQYVL